MPSLENEITYMQLNSIPRGTPIYLFHLSPCISAPDKTFATSHWPSDTHLVPDDPNDFVLKAATLELSTPDAISTTNAYLRAKKFGDASGSATHPNSSCNTRANASCSCVSISNLNPNPESHADGEADADAASTPFHGVPTHPWVRMVQLVFPGPEDWPKGVVYTDIVALGLYEYERRRRGEAPLWADQHGNGQIPRWRVMRRPRDILKVPRDAVAMRLDGLVYRVWDLMGEGDDGSDSDEDEDEDEDEDGDDIGHWMNR